MCLNVKGRWKLHKPHWSIHINIVLDYNDWAYHNEICNNEVKWKAKLNNKHMGKWKLMHPILKWFFKTNMKRRRIKKKKEGEENGCEKRGKEKWKSESHETSIWKKFTIFFMRSMFLCWAQTLIYCNTPSRIFWSFQHFKIYMLIPEDSLSHKGGSKLWPFFTIPFGSPSLLMSMALTTSLSILMLESRSERQNYAPSILTCLQKNIVISPNTKHDPFFDSSSSI